MALSRTSESENTCVVCFKNVDVYSVGPCDHPVCYECSTRMRVLCKQLECPICRQIIPKAIFTKAIQQFSKLLSNIGSFKKDSEYEIYFSEPSLETSFKKLLEHRCKKCSRQGRLYDNFSTLSDHLRREHELFFCDLCLEHLKIFTWERKTYTRSELATHRRKGDPDDKSLKGHPLCEFCDRRYFDRDELYRHLRKDHFFCHFCDADGTYDYYGAYPDLTDHFRRDHFLCEEGDCRGRESYTRVFRSEIDFKAHRAQHHIQGLGKAAVKQARTLELEFQLCPRDERGRGRGGPSRGGMRREREQPEIARPEPTFVPSSNQQPDVSNKEEFPSLAGNSNDRGGSGGSQKSLAHKIATKNNMTVRSTNADDDDFPTLGKPTVFVRLSSQDDSNSNVQIKLKQNFSQPSSSGAATQQPVIKAAPNQPKAMVTRMSSTNNIKLQPSGPVQLGQDFPALPTAGAQSFTPQWITKQKNEPKSASSVIKVPKNDFPSLPSVSGPPIKPVVPKKASSVTIPMQKPKTVIEPEKAKKKKQKIPDEERMDFSLPSDHLGIKIPKHIPNGDLGGPSTQSSKIQMISNLDQMKLGSERARQQPVQKPEFSAMDFPSLGDVNAVEPDKPYTKKVAEQKKKQKNEQKSASAKENQPPKENRFAAFASSDKNSSQRNSDMTFTSSSGETFSVGGDNGFENGDTAAAANGTGCFVQPPGFGGRNNGLRDLIRDLLGGDVSAMMEFQDISKKFRSGSISAKNYYELIQDLFGSSSFEVVFPELLVLLPDVARQQELYEVHKKSGGTAQFIPCAVCGQILAPSDLKHHKVSHTLDDDFPGLA